MIHELDGHTGDGEYARYGKRFPMKMLLEKAMKKLVEYGLSIDDAVGHENNVLSSTYRKQWHHLTRAKEYLLLGPVLPQRVIEINI